LVMIRRLAVHVTFRLQYVGYIYCVSIHQQILKEAVVPFCLPLSDLESDISEKEKGSKQDSGAHVFSQVNWYLKSALLIQIRMDPHYSTAS
jgi:hypothetical protein